MSFCPPKPAFEVRHPTFRSLTPVVSDPPPVAVLLLQIS